MKTRMNYNTEYYCDKSHTFHPFTLIVGYPGGSSYVSTKFAIKVLSESIA
jgi:NAD(P)-dependent dehydrogenase (short-subunit alcohol dehydrogenase family)